jgi:hypothetical protein
MFDASSTRAKIKTSRRHLYPLFPPDMLALYCIA